MLDAYLTARRRELDRIPADRRLLLDALARAIAERTDDAVTGPLPLVFVCTHNSRRSHLGAVWAQVAADRGGFSGKIVTHSGGTEATAVAPGVVATLRRAGCEVTVERPGDNPVHAVRPAAGAEPLHCWSKRYDDPANPDADFVAVLVCSDADAHCPVVPGTTVRITIPYDDPKPHDGTDREAAAYDACCARIAREMLYVFQRAATLRP